MLKEVAALKPVDNLRLLGPWWGLGGLISACLLQLIGVKSCFLFSTELKSLDFFIFIFLYFVISDFLIAVYQYCKYQRRHCEIGKSVFHEIS